MAFSPLPWAGEGGVHLTCLGSRCFLSTSCGSGSVGSVSLSTAFSLCGEGAHKYSPRQVRCEELALMLAVCTPRQRDLRCGGGFFSGPLPLFPSSPPAFSPWLPAVGHDKHVFPRDTQADPVLAQMWHKY